MRFFKVNTEIDIMEKRTLPLFVPISLLIIIFISMTSITYSQGSPSPTPGGGGLVPPGSPSPTPGGGGLVPPGSPSPTPGPTPVPGTGDEQVKAALKKFCGLVYELIPLTALTMVLTAAVVYAAGQFFGAETRARANVWATSMLTGALIGIIIVVIVPWLLQIAYPQAKLSGACQV